MPVPNSRKSMVMVNILSTRYRYIVTYLPSIVDVVDVVIGGY